MGYIYSVMVIKTPISITRMRMLYVCSDRVGYFYELFALRFAYLGKKEKKTLIFYTVDYLKKCHATKVGKITFLKS